MSFNSCKLKKRNKTAIKAKIIKFNKNGGNRTKRNSGKDDVENNFSAEKHRKAGDKRQKGKLINSRPKRRIQFYGKIF